MRRMPTANRLLGLYPRAWRARYGEEFLATVGDGTLRFPQAMDVVMGAIDAWLSADVRNGTRAWGVATDKGGLTMLKSMIACDRTSVRFTKRDSLIGAGVMIGASFLFLVLGIVMRRAGWPVAGEMLKALAFPGSLMLSMPFWLMKGQPWKAQAVIVSATLAILLAASYLSTKI